MDEIEQRMNAAALALLRANADRESARLSMNNAKEALDLAITRFDALHIELVNCRRALANIVIEWEELN